MVNTLQISWKKLIDTSKKLKKNSKYDKHRYTPRHIIVKMLKVKYKEKIGKTAKEK